MLSFSLGQAVLLLDYLLLSLLCTLALCCTVAVLSSSCNANERRRKGCFGGGGQCGEEQRCGGEKQCDGEGHCNGEEQCGEERQGCGEEQFVEEGQFGEKGLPMSSYSYVNIEGSSGVSSHDSEGSSV